MTIEIKILLNASQEHVFNAWIDQVYITQWLCSYAEISAKRGGKYWLFFNSIDNAEHSTKGCRFLNYEAFQMIEFNWKGPKKFFDSMNMEGYLTSVKVNITSIDPGSSSLVLIHYGWKSSEDWQEARLWHINFWNNKLQTLQKYLES